MATILNYQLTIFGTYSVEPSPENVTLLMNAINHVTDEMFLPNLISGQQVDIPTNRITTISNLGYVTQNQKYNISILNERVDINYQRVDDSEMTITDFFNFAVKVLSAIMDASHLQARRLAANIQVLANTLTEDQLARLGKSLITSAAYYDNKPFIEWSTRINSESTIHIKNVEEKLNTILNIVTARSTPAQTPALVYHLDINTLPQLAELRFDVGSLGEFVNEVIPIAESIINDVERLISVD